MPLAAGVDSSTQSCKIVIWDAETGRLVREGRASNPDGMQVHPDAWEQELQEAAATAGGLTDVAAVAVGAQQDGMVCLDPTARWSGRGCCGTTRSAAAAADLVAELCPDGRSGGPSRSVRCRWQRSRSPSCVGWPSTSRAGCPDHRPRRRQRHGLLVPGYRQLPNGLAAPCARRRAAPCRPCSAPLTPLDVRAPAGAVLGAGTGDVAAAALGPGSRGAHPDLPDATVQSAGCGWRPRRRRTCPRRRSRACFAVWRTGPTPWSPRGLGRAGAAHRRGRQVRRRAPARTVCVRLPRPGASAGRVTSPTARPGRRRGCSAVARRPPTGGAGERCRSASGRAATSPALRRSVHARRPPGQRGTPRPTAWHRRAGQSEEPAAQE